MLGSSALLGRTLLLSVSLLLHAPRCWAARTTARVAAKQHPSGRSGWKPPRKLTRAVPPPARAAAAARSATRGPTEMRSPALVAVGVVVSTVGFMVLPFARSEERR